MKIFFSWPVVVLGTIFFAGCSYQSLLTSDDISSEVTITETRTTIEITRDENSISDTGLLFYPGGLVDNHVYNGILSYFVEETGVTTVIVKMPANLAVFDINAASDVIPDYPNITTWIIAGHSLGGSMAAQTVKNNPSDYKGLIFMDSYPADSTSLKDWSGSVLSIYSSIEKVSDDDQMTKIFNLLPDTIDWDGENSDYPDDTSSSYTVVKLIEGGCHSYFGSYGPQDGDYEPTITREEFHADVIEYMTEFFSNNNWVVTE